MISDNGLIQATNEVDDVVEESSFNVDAIDMSFLMQSKSIRLSSSDLSNIDWDSKLADLLG